MKKLAIFTSILALAACGGGSGGGGSAPIIPENPIVPDTPFVDTVADSNSEITGMISNSEYQVARYVAHKLGDYASDVNLSRVATTRGAFVPKTPTGDTDYDTARELVDLAAWLANDTTTKDEIESMYKRSSADKNKIKAALKLMDDMYCFVGTAEETANRIISRRDANEFVAPLTDLQQKTEIFDINTVNFDLAAGRMSDYGQKIKFSTDERGRIKDITLSDNPIFDGVNRDGENGTFTLTGQSIYRYSIPIDDTEEEFFAEGAPTIEVLQNKLRAQIAERFATDTDQYEHYNSIVDGLSDEIVADAGGKQILNATFTPELKGGDVGLKYSDFGLMHIQTHFQGRDPEVISEAIAGGYQTKAVENIETAMHFEGRTIGSVQYRHYGDDKVIENASVPLSGRAYMEYNPGNGSQQVNLEFNDWYNVSVDTAGNINFVEHDGTTTDSRFKFNSENPTFTDAAVNYNKPADQMGPDTSGEVVLNYFGENGVASEAVGYVKVGQDYDGGNGTDKSLLFNAGFGMKAN